MSCVICSPESHGEQPKLLVVWTCLSRLWSEAEAIFHGSIQHFLLVENLIRAMLRATQGSISHAKDPRSLYRNDFMRLVQRREQLVESLFVGAYEDAVTAEAHDYAKL